MGKYTGAYLIRYALEQLPVRYTFGIPGVHITELYDELGKSDRIEPVLVTHEAAGAFMADGISRSAPPTIGVLAIVPAAGPAYAAAGIAEAFLDGIPMLVVAGGVRTDVPYHYQLHELDQIAFMETITKKAYRVTSHDRIVPTIFEAYETAISGVPGPVFVEVPADIQLFRGEVAELPTYTASSPGTELDTEAIAAAVELLAAAEHPGIFVGWGAVDVVEAVAEIAERLGAPVATTLQGLSAFPARHPLHTGMGFGPHAVPAATNAFAGCDALLAIGTRFGEIPTGSYGIEVPEALVHVDIDPRVFDVNYPAKVKIAADSRRAVPALAAALRERGIDHAERRERLAARIAADKAAYREEWYRHRSDRVNPARFFDELRRALPEDGITVVDDGNHTFLAAELYEVLRPRTFFSPTDFNCMGYAVPAAIGAKLANPDRQVVAIVGDGAFLMTSLEITTAATMGLGVVFFVFDDGELSQISQGQEIPYNRKTCTVLGSVRYEGIAQATGAAHVVIHNDDELADGIARAFAEAAEGRPVVVDVRIDYGKRTRFTQGVVKTVLKRMPWSERFRFIGRALVRRVTG